MTESLSVNIIFEEPIDNNYIKTALSTKSTNRSPNGQTQNGQRVVTLRVCYLVPESFRCA